MYGGPFKNLALTESFVLCVHGFFITCCGSGGCICYNIQCVVFGEINWVESGVNLFLTCWYVCMSFFRLQNRWTITACHPNHDERHCPAPVPGDGVPTASHQVALPRRTYRGPVHQSPEYHCAEAWGLWEIQLLCPGQDVQLQAGRI